MGTVFMTHGKVQFRLPEGVCEVHIMSVRWSKLQEGGSNGACMNQAMYRPEELEALLIELVLLRSQRGHWLI